MSDGEEPPPGDGHRVGAVRKRSQVKSPLMDQWVKRNAETGRFMDIKDDGEKFKGVRREKPRRRDRGRAGP